MSESFAAQLSAVATAILAAFAFITAILAWRAFRTQSEEVRDQARMLEVQQKVYELQTPVIHLQIAELQESLEERKREAERRRNGQASRVFITEERHVGRDDGPVASRPPTVTATARNTSDQPVYDAEFWWYSGSGGYGYPNPESLGTVMPGAKSQSRRAFGPDAPLEACGAVFRFRDAAGVTWERRADGFLGEQPSGDGDQVPVLPGSRPTWELPRISGQQAPLIELLQRSLQQRERDAEEQRRSQAARVSAWFDREKPDGNLWGAWIQNASDLPITEVRTAFRYVQKAQPTAGTPGITEAPGTTRSTTDDIPVIPPQQKRFIEIPLSVQDEIKQTDYSVSIEFTDAVGNRWERDSRGALTPSR